MQLAAQSTLNLSISYITLDFIAQKNTKHVHVLGLEGRMHDTNTRPTTNCATTIEENIYRSNSRVEQSNNTHMKNHFLRIQTNKPQRAPSKRSLPPSLYIN